ncbi:hypothetical protein [Dermacoccus nishinomiyaensis]|uniref:hypothetical protein n=1 Tax=Dermacoccus nishinomiyaensis TaxID=1274 RepID=UPI001EF71EAA|nr:hypothetical protein [Dermacoccus nishinomiyaensis]MCG7430642.1 hypothetical protein [Dermacoccus nishinomiyaensis]
MKESQAGRASDRKNAYYVAVKFSATGIDDQTGVWVANDLSDPATIMAVDGTVKEFSDYPDGSAQDFSVTDGGAKQARACVGG